MLGDVLDALRVAFLFRIPALLVGTFVFALAWRLGRSGEPLRVALPQALARDRARVDTPDKLRVHAPVAAAVAAWFAFPAAFLSVTAAGVFGAKGVVPPPADAGWQLLTVALGAAAAVVVLGCWFGFGTCLRAVAFDGVPAVLITITLGLAITPPVLIFSQVESRPAWLAMLAAQLSWPIAALIVGGIVSGRRKRRLFPPPRRAPRPAPDSWFTKYGIEAGHVVVLVSPGDRKIPVISAVRRLTGMGLQEAKDLIDTAPSLVMTHVTSDRADHARQVLESLGATVTVSEDVARS